MSTYGYKVNILLNPFIIMELENNGYNNDVIQEAKTIVNYFEKTGKTNTNSQSRIAKLNTGTPFENHMLRFLNTHEKTLNGENISLGYSLLAREWWFKGKIINPVTYHNPILKSECIYILAFDIDRISVLLSNIPGLDKGKVALLDVLSKMFKVGHASCATRFKDLQICSPFPMYFALREEHKKYVNIEETFHYKNKFGGQLIKNKEWYFSEYSTLVNELNNVIMENNRGNNSWTELKGFTQIENKPLDLKIKLKEEKLKIANEGLFPF